MIVKRFPLHLFAALLLSACEIPSALPRFQPVFLIPAENVSVNVTSQLASAQESKDLSDFDEDLEDRVLSGALVVDIDNPSSATGTAMVQIEGGGAEVEGVITLSGGDGQRIEIGQADMRAFLGELVFLTAIGTLCPASGCGPVNPPFPQVTFDARIEVTLEIGGEG